MDIDWSHTSSQMYRNCNRTIWLKKRQHISNNGKPRNRVVSPFSLLGITIHETLESELGKYIGKKIFSDFRIENASLFTLFDRKLSEILPFVDWTGMDDKGRMIEWVKKMSKKNLRNAKTLLNTNARGYKVLEVEQKWKYELDGDLKLIVLADLVLQSPEDEIFVVDWKTQKDLQSDINNPQLGVYKLLAEKKYGKKEINTVIAYTERVNWSTPWYSPKFTSELEYNIIEEIERWKSNRIEDFPANPHPVNCSSCRYITRCDVAVVSEEIYFM